MASLEENRARDWDDIRFIDTLMSRHSEMHPRLAMVSLMTVFRFLQLHCEDRDQTRDDVAGSPSDYEEAVRRARSLRFSICTSSLYGDVPVDVQLHVTVLSNYVYHFANYMLRREQVRG